MKRKLIGFLTANPENEVQNRLIEGLFSQCKYYGYDVAVVSPLVQISHYFKDYLKGELNIYNLINLDLFDGLIIDSVSLSEDNTSWVLEAIGKQLKKVGYTNVVTIDVPIDGIHMVETDDVKAFRTLTDHVLDVHHCQNVWYLSGPEEMAISQKRLEGVKRSFEAHGKRFNIRNVIYGDFWYTGGEKLAQMIYDTEKRPDAVICASDYMAIGLANSLLKRGISVPDEIIVTGFDAIAEGAINDLAITTYTPESGAAAAEAVNYLRGLIDPDKTIIDSADAGYGGLLCCDSCGCRTNMKYVRRRLGKALYRSQINYGDDGIADKINIGLLLDSYMFENLTSAESPEDCLKRIFANIYLVRPFDHFYLCLRDDWTEHDKKLVERYPPKMRMVMHAVPGEFSEDSGQFCEDSPEREFDTRLMIPSLKDERSEPCVFYFSPVHFEDNTFGYAVLQCALQKMRKLDVVFHNWIRNLDNALEMARAQNRLRDFSERDPMTGLLNRRALDNWLEEIKPGENRHALFMVADMDGLKTINDNYGHLEGDYGINCIAEAIKSITRFNELCVRAGGDEFYLVGLGDYDEETLAERERQFYKKLDEINRSSGKEYEATASIGSAICDYNGEDTFKKLLKQADANMYRNKYERKKKHLL